MLSKLVFKRTGALPIGLDVGRSGIRLAQLQDTSEGLTVFRSASWSRERSADEPADHEEVIRRLQRFAGERGFAGRAVVAGLGAPDVELHPLDLPVAKDRVGREQLHKAAAWEIQRLTTLESASLQTAVWQLPESSRSKATYMGVAALQERVRAMHDLCHAASMDCVKVDVAACALSSLVWRLQGRPADKVWGLLDLGDRHTRLVICLDDSPVMVRTFEMGGHAWTQRIAERLNLSYDAAERNKLELGLAQEAAGGSGHGEWSALMKDILEEDLKRLSLETERSYEYVLQCYAPRKPGDLVLVGGGARLKGLDAFLKDRLGIAVMPVSQCDGPETRGIAQGLADNEALENFALACALSMQGVGHA